LQRRQAGRQRREAFRQAGKQFDRKAPGETIQADLD
jgi:hypothetical protein